MVILQVVLTTVVTAILVIVIKSLIDSKRQEKFDKAVEKEAENFQDSLMEVRTWIEMSKWLMEFEEATVEVKGMFFADSTVLDELLNIYFFIFLGDLTEEHELKFLSTHTEEQKAWTKGWNDALKNIMSTYRDNEIFKVLTEEA